MELRTFRRPRLLAAAVATVVLVATPGSVRSAPNEDDPRVAQSLATLLQSARSVISDKQSLIDDAARGDKGLTGRVVLDLTLAAFHRTTGRDALEVDPASREGTLLRAEMGSIAAVVDNNQSSINAPGVGFKGFIPAVFGRLVTEAFAARAGGEATIKITAPLELVRNRKSRPDQWERAVIEQRFRSPDWKPGAAFAESATEGGFRMAVPEYYTESCLACHGSPKGSLDITGYPREGASLGDLGAVVSITLSR